MEHLWTSRRWIFLKSLSDTCTLPSSHWFCVVALVTEFECDKTGNSMNQRKTLPSICDFHVKDGMCIGLFFFFFFLIYIYMYIYMGVCVSDLIQSKNFSKLIMCLYCIGFNSQVYWIHKYTELKFCPIVLISWK